MSRRAIVELRQYALKIGHAGEYIQRTREAAGLRKSLFPMRLYTIPETGGQLNVANHMYMYKDGLEGRDGARARAAVNKDWLEYLKAVRPFMETQQSNIFVEAPLVSDFQLQGLSPETVEVSTEAETPGKCIYEFRNYQLKLGYDTVPAFLDHYEEGLGSKLASTDPTTTLVSLLYSEIGGLNKVIEIWRHGNGVSAMENSRNGAREAAEWRTAIGSIADLAVSFESTVHKPVDFSSYQ